MEYTVRPTSVPLLQADWSDPAWTTETLDVGHFRPESSDHRPHTTARLQYDARGIYGIFQVEDRHVLCRRTNYGDPVWKDSCVEFFAQPRPDRGYFNFEFNCGGAFLCSYITDPERTPDGFKAWVKLPPELGQTIQSRGSLPKRVEPEMTGPVVWTLNFFIPFSVIEHYVGSLTMQKPIAGQVWRANFYKCANESSHPHWACWAPVDQLNFHRPNCFETIRFA